ncbi:uncharacterized protein LOC123660547 [Melitaea cinxia]|uniref:uncharacterized protein LOC123660547 n=1 Tax=Melitaea cinxia TaxID=113334 RepID=UPI001E27235C|nr:uncharacterized protein LOC123660547 [Melitaea cinxia]
MEKEKRQRVSLPQMVVSGEGSEARVKVKVEAAGGGGEAGGAAGAESAGAVGRMVDSSQADDRKLIRLVRERRLLYARNNMPVASYYTQVKNLWDDVAAIMGWSVADVRRKWSHIRNSYSRHLRNEMHGACTSKGRMVSRWYLADELEFLREHMATDMRSSPYSSYAPTLLEMDLNESSSSETVDIKPFIHNSWFALNATSSPVLEPKPLSFQNEDSSSSNAFTADENSSFFQFFRGIHSEFLELSPKRQRQFKRKCLDYLHELLDEEDNNHQHGYSHQDNVLNLSNSVHMSVEEREVKPVVEHACTLSSN